MLTKDEMDFVIQLIDRIRPSVKPINQPYKPSTIEKWVEHYYNKDTEKLTMNKGDKK